MLHDVRIIRSSTPWISSSHRSRWISMHQTLPKYGTSGQLDLRTTTPLLNWKRKKPAVQVAILLELAGPQCLSHSQSLYRQWQGEGWWLQGCTCRSLEPTAGYARTYSMSATNTVSCVCMCTSSVIRRPSSIIRHPSKISRQRESKLGCLHASVIRRPSSVVRQPLSPNRYM